MRLTVVIDLDAVTPTAIERRAVIAASREYRAPAFPLVPFLAHLGETWLPHSRGSRAASASIAYRPAGCLRRLLVNRSV